MLANDHNARDARRRTARRTAGIVPVVVFILTLVLLAGPADHTPYQFLQLLVHAALAALASAFLCIAAYGFYRYLSDRSPGL